MANGEVKLVLRAEGGSADDGVMDIYDAANTIYGLARSVNMIAHSLANNGEVRKKNKVAIGAKAFIQSSIKGCFEEQVVIKFDKKIVSAVGPSVFNGVFWDYFRWVWLGAVGESWQPETRYVQNMNRENELLIHEISDALEKPMQFLHKSVDREASVRIYINRPKVGDIAELNAVTRDYVTVRQETTRPEFIVGNVTRFNILSYFGRIYSDIEGRTISFELADDEDRKVRDLAMKSMQDHDRDGGGKMRFKVVKIMSAHDVVKRYVVHDILAL